MTKYQAFYNGKLVGKRTSATRTYTHAVVCQRNEALSRDAAFNYVATETDRSNYDYDVEVVAAGRAHSSFKYDSAEHITEQLTEAIAEIEGGFDAYVARQRDLAIERFEEQQARGSYEPGVISWCGRLDLAQKEFAKWSRPNWSHTEALAIVEAVVVTKHKRKG